MNGFQHQENVDNYFLLLKTRLSAILRWIWHIFPIFLVDKQKKNLCLHFFLLSQWHRRMRLVKKWNWLVIAECFSKETGSLNNLCSEKTPPMLAVRLDFELGWSRWNLDKLTRAMLVLIIDKNDSSCYNHQIIICLPNYLKPNFFI